MGDHKDGRAIDRAFDAFSSGDMAAARDCFAAHAQVWHGFDGVARDVDETIADWAQLVTAFPERGLADVRRRSAGDGVFVQQHLFVVRDKAGVRRAWPVCLVVRVQDDRILRLDEYIDRAGSFVAPDGQVKTPGF